MGRHFETVSYHNPNPEDESGLSAHLARMMGEVPFCDVCGHITIRMDLSSSVSIVAMK